MCVRLRNTHTDSLRCLHATTMQTRRSLLLPRELSWWVRDFVCDTNDESDDSTDTNGTVCERSVRRYVFGLPTMHARYGLSQLLRAWNLRDGLRQLCLRAGNLHADTNIHTSDLGVYWRLQPGRSGDG